MILKIICRIMGHKPQITVSVGEDCQKIIAHCTRCNELLGEIVAPSWGSAMRFIGKYSKRSIRG